MEMGLCCGGVVKQRIHKSLARYINRRRKLKRGYFVKDGAKMGYFKMDIIFMRKSINMRY